MLDSPIEFLEQSAGVVRNVDSGAGRDAALLIRDCVRRRGVINEGGNWNLIEAVARRSQATETCRMVIGTWSLIRKG